jgi:hypothetical protein
MVRLAAAWLAFSMLMFAQNPAAADLQNASRSPDGLARSVASSKRVNWAVLWRGLHTPPVDPVAYFLCHDDCVAEVLEVPVAGQAIVLISRESGASSEVYLRYTQAPDGQWRFAGKHATRVKEFPRHYEFEQVGGAPFFKVSNDFSQVGFGLTERVEDWFDLTQPGFEPAFSFVIEGEASRIGYGIGNAVRAHPAYRKTAHGEAIDLRLDVTFEGPGFQCPAQFFGVYERGVGEKKFSLRRAYADAEHQRPMRLSDFAGLGGSNLDIAQRRLLTYAFPGLQPLVAGLDDDAREWLSLMMRNHPDTPQKRALVRLLAKR